MQLLTDRFQLKVRRETQNVASYALPVNPGTVKLKKGAPDANYSFRIGRGQWTITRVDMSRFAQDLTQEVGVTVVDATGLMGFYDVTLEWAFEAAVASNSEDRPVTMRSTLFDAIREQLGLSLESRKLPIEMLFG